MHHGLRGEERALSQFPLWEQLLRNLVYANGAMAGDIAQDRSQGSERHRPLTRNSGMMLAAIKRGKPQMTSCLPSLPVADARQRFRQVVA
jgi:hypothetical protein